MRGPLTAGRLQASTPVRRRAARGRRPAAKAPPPPPPARQPFGGLRRPLQDVLERLDRDAERVQQAWQKLLGTLASRRAHREALAALDLAGCYRPLWAGAAAGLAVGDEAYRLEVERCARAVRLAGVPENDTVRAVALYLEASVGHARRPAEARALVRLSWVTQRLVAACYAEQGVAALRSLDDRERQKLAGDLHDEVGADLVVLKLYIEMIAVEVAKGGGTPVGPKLQEALALIGHAIESVRRLTMDLGPAFLESLGFLPALRSFARQFSLRTGIEVQLHETDAPTALPASHQTALYRVARGALSNVAKHSQARHATVGLRAVGGVIVMSIEDDGLGFDVRAQAADRSVGLMAMRERVHALGGRLSISSRRASRGGRPGTRLEVRLPLDRGSRS